MLPWLKEWGVALLVGDAANDLQPSGVEGFNRPIHTMTPYDRHHKHCQTSLLKCGHSQRPGVNLNPDKRAGIEEPLL